MAVNYMTSIGDPKQLNSLLKDDVIAGKSEKRIVFAGRSNAGKSSLLNSLTRSKIAQISREPGKTRKVNLFYCSFLKRVLSDLPGYGFAKRNKTERKLWEELITSYLIADKENIERIILVTDCRHGPADSDLDAMDFFQELGFSVTLVLSKSDKLNQKARSKRNKEIKELLQDSKPEKKFWISSLKGTGVRELSRDIINDPTTTD
ncbi:ribosome biogenesis GTP-binding protein YihA/YsxC [Lentisphaera marina]|uniref:ribosome biogenesis GTP-binding protein YihA/YsxC n=1 Tax=Lentisphaera marina TaxID=1111041 RepID=UPI0023666E53|nr:ribosome biogenesis GTP-binding protein YihA/YsxC [Lentisphaera marina]MDD7983529.1 ribosome biogenesis GTP-binding protein YihA/YsxC [Lentisphaera marina]